MNTRDLFTIIIKLFGLYSLIFSLLGFLPNLTFLFHNQNSFTVFWIICSMILIVSICFGFMVYASKFVDFLKLPNDLEPRVDFGNLTADTIVKLGVIITAGIILATNFSTFFSYTLYAFKGDMGYTLLGTFEWTLSLVNLVVGSLLLVFYKPITVFIGLTKLSNDDLLDEWEEEETENA